MNVGTFVLGGEVEVARLGFGTLQFAYREDEAVAVLRRVVELGVNLIDTADIYGNGRAEELVAEALHPYPDHVVIATKGGILPRGGERTRDGRPEYLRAACEASLRRLRADRIDLYQLHRHDPDVPLEESIGALDELRREGKIRLVGVSNFGVEQLERARRVAPIVSVQNEFNRWLETSDAVVDACERNGIAFLPWSPLGDGKANPARELQWLLDRSRAIIPIPGTSSLEHAEELFAPLNASA